MKKLFFIPVLLLVMAACSKDNTMPTTTSSAVKAYQQYADREDLTVALIGNYQKDGDTYNALMIQATTDQAWDSLMAEFCSETIGLDEEISAVATHYFHADTTLGEMDSYFASIADSLMGGDVPSTTNNTVTVSKTYENGVLVDSSTTTGTSVDTTNIRRDLVGYALEDGQVGYIVHIESTARTIWLLFYSNEREYNAIVNNIID